MPRSPLIKQLSARARALGARAVDDLLANEDRAKTVTQAVRRVQQARTVLDEQGARMLGAMGLATHVDVERVGRKVARLRKRLQALLERLDVEV